LKKRLNWIGLDESQKNVTLHAFENFSIPLSDNISLHSSAQLAQATFLDVETTGLNPLTDEIIELSARNVFFDPLSGEIVSVSKQVFNSFNEPTIPIPPKITILTGIDKNDVASKKINWTEFENYIKNSQLIIAHNALFDRTLVEKSFKPIDIVWGCSTQNIDWLSKGYDSAKLNLLCIYHGFFNSTAHRASSDVDCLIHLLTFKNSKKSSYFNELLANSHEQKFIVTIINTVYEMRFAITKLGFRWEPKNKSWNKVVGKNEIQPLIEKLTSSDITPQIDYKISDIPLTYNYRPFSSILNR
jgi:DNA polymerase-3 subunit epsilon